MSNDITPGFTVYDQSGRVQGTITAPTLNAAVTEARNVFPRGSVVAPEGMALSDPLTPSRRV